MKTLILPIKCIMELFPSSEDMYVSSMVQHIMEDILNDGMEISIDGVVEYSGELLIGFPFSLVPSVPWEYKQYRTKMINELQQAAHDYMLNLLGDCWMSIKTNPCDNALVINRLQSSGVEYDLIVVAKFKK